MQVQIKYEDTIGGWDEVLAAQKKYNECIGYSMLNKIERLKDSIYIFSQNYSDLKTHFEKFTDEYILKIIKLDDGTARTEIHRNTSRYLFNYLSSAVALREHTKKFMTEFEKTEFDKLTEKYILDNFPKGINSFIKKLRNNIMHIEIPIHSMHHTIKEITKNGIIWNRELVFDTKELVSNSSFEWNNDSIEYINNNLSFSSISIEKFCNDYYKMISEYYDWFFKTFSECYKSELNECEELKKDYEMKSQDYSSRLAQLRLTAMNNSKIYEK